MVHIVQARGAVHKDVPSTLAEVFNFESGVLYSPDKNGRERPTVLHRYSATDVVVRRGNSGKPTRYFTLEGGSAKGVLDDFVNTYDEGGLGKPELPPKDSQTVYFFEVEPSSVPSYDVSASDSGSVDAPAGSYTVPVLARSSADKSARTSTQMVSRVKTKKDTLSTRGYIVLSPLPHSQCDMTLTAEVTVKDNELRLRTADMLLRPTVALVAVAFRAFFRGKEVDEAVSEDFHTNTMPNAPPLTQQEEAAVAKALAYAASSDVPGNFTRIPKSLALNTTFEMFEKQIEDEPTLYKGVGEVHASAESVFINLFKWCSYERMAIHAKENGNTPRSSEEIPNSHSQLVTAVKKFPWALANRIFENCLTWKAVEDFEGRGRSAIVLAFAPIEEYKRDGEETFLTPGRLPDATTVHGQTWGVYILEELAPRVCKMTLVQKGTFGGTMPQKFVNILGAQLLGIIGITQMMFGRLGRAVDKEKREAFAAKLTASPPQLSEEALDIVRRGYVDLKAEFDKDTHRSTKLTSSSWACSMEIKQLPTNEEEERAVGTGKITCRLDCPVGIASAFAHHFCSNERVEISQNEGNPARLEVSSNGVFDITISSVITMPKPLTNRQFASREVVQALPDGSIVVAWVPLLGDVDYGFSTKGIVKGTSIVFYKFTPVENNANSCDAELVIRLDAGGLIPALIINKKVPLALTALISLRNALQQDAAIDADDLRLVVEGMREEGNKPKMTVEDDRLRRSEAILFVLPEDNSSCTKEAVPATDALMTTEMMLQGTEKSAVFRTELVVDGTPEQVAASITHVETRANKKAFLEEHGGKKLEVDKSEDSPRSQTVTSTVKPP